MKLKLIVGLALAVGLTWSQRAKACGCFAPPGPAEPIVQAGERILFSVKEGKVTAHIQIQYAGDAKDFGWLLPLPSVPTLKLGSDELFARLAATTQPSYRTNAMQGIACKPGPTPLFACGCYAPSSNRLFSEQLGPQDAGTHSPLVFTSSIGPYEYAVLAADDQTAMLQWLSANRYFVPAGTDGALTPYIHPGAYFLALKLKANASAGDVTPVIIEYPSSLPMIPLILTSVGATPNMGVQVYLLGNGRGIPRNYHHVVLNDSLLDWANSLGNYSALVTQAVSEAPAKHAFVTEYAGPSSVMWNQLIAPGRFGLEEELAQTPTPQAFAFTLVRNGFLTQVAGGASVFPAAVLRALQEDIPFPPALAAKGIDPSRFYEALDYYLVDYRAQNPMDFENYTLAFEPVSLARQIFADYVEPLRATNALFSEFPTLTRLFTTLNPEDMTADPVFSFNSDLPMVGLTHDASLIMDCGSSRLITEQGWTIAGAQAMQPPPPVQTTPAALRVEVLGEEGAPTVVTDNTELIHSRFQLITDPTPKEESPTPANGCSTIDPMSLGLLTLMWMRRRRSA